MRAALFLLLVASCTHQIDVFDRVDDVSTARDLDILYVFDNSADRATYDQMASQLDILQTQLASVDGQVPNLHVGVVTTDLGTKGTLDDSAAPSIRNCAGEGDAGRLVTFNTALTKPYLEDLRGPNGTRVRNFESDDDGDLAAELALLTNPPLGKAGCEFAQPLEAMRRALDPTVNPGFMRDGALLQIVFLTNEDDCSLKRGAMLDATNGTLGAQSFRCTSQGVICDDDPATPGTHTNCRPREGSEFMVDVSAYKTFLDTVKPAGDVLVSAVVGARDPFTTVSFGGPQLTPSCQGPAGSAKPAVRIGSLVDSFGGTIVDSCTQEAAYDQISAPLIGKQSSCFANLRRTDGEDCRVIESAAGIETELPKCADGMSTACWFTYADAAMCPTGDNVGIAIKRGNSTAPAKSQIQATCFLP